jgi:diadenosine tetraphosphate (Ap4A) HIT family hydrolase
LTRNGDMNNIAPFLSFSRPVPAARAQKAPTAKAVELCSFCEEFHDPKSVTMPLLRGFFAEFGQDSRVLLETGSFVVVPSLGALVPGHILILPRSHYFSTAEMPEPELRYLESLASRSREIVSEVYGPCSFFEHGCVEGIGKAGACIDHAHLHLLPVGENLQPEIERKFGLAVSVRGLRDLKQFVSNGIPYLYYRPPDGLAYGYEARTAPTQFFRQLVFAARQDVPSWDWKSDLRVEAVKQTYDSLIAAFQELRKKL